MDRNIQDSKEYRLAKEWEMAVNSYSFDPRKFAAAIPDMHPTLQQAAVTMTATGHRMRRRSASWNISMNTESIYH